MKKILTILFFYIFVIQIAVAQSPYWMRSAGGSAADEGIDISIDANDNTYTTGFFSGTTTFATGVTLTASGATDIFVSKVNNLGVLQWVVKAGGMGPDRGFSIKSDLQGNCYVTGIYFGAATFGSTTINSIGGSQDVFIAKYNTTGVLQWVVSAGGPEGESGNGINVDNNGNVFVTGQFSGTAQFGSFSLSSMINPSTSLPSIDIFTTKLNSSGNFLWAKKGSAEYTDRGIDIATDPSGNVYITGQFSDTITFDAIHNNNMYNAIFLIKYNGSGVEQWFRKIGGSSMNISYGIAVDANSNIYLTGDFLSSLIFFGSPDVQLSNTYQNNIFLAKYNSSGNLLWAQADGSTSDVSSRNLALDDSSNAYIVGNFRCTFSEYADVFGQGTFNSVGYKDIFVTKYNCNGQRQWMRQGGGQQEDFGAGIAVNTYKQAIITGNFYEKIFFPADINFTYPNSIYFSPFYSAYIGTYCSDPNYGHYCSISSYGNSDILIAKSIDPSRQPYDYYTRFPGSCSSPFVSGCINDGSADNVCDGDSIEACGQAHLYGATNTSEHSPGIYSPGPYFTWIWSNGSTNSTITTTSSGNYSVTITSQDGCYTSSDTIHVTIHPLPAVPLISDNHVVNTNALYPQTIFLCYPENVTLTGTTSAPHYYWTDDNGSPADSSYSITVDETGIYSFIVFDDFGCMSGNVVHVVVDSALIPLNLGIMLCNDIDHNDSIEICLGDVFTILIYDTITNPLGNFICIDYAITSWTVTPSITAWDYCDTWLNCYPTQSGYYQIGAQMIRMNNCDTDTIILSKTIYVTVYPVPIVNITISGNTVICPGDTTVLTASGSLSYSWGGGPGIISNPNLASVTINLPGYYYVTSTVIDSNGCSGSGTASAVIFVKPSPLVTMIPSSGLICPNDSVLLHCSGVGSFQWYSPSGPFGTNTAFVYVSAPGYYFCVLTDTSGCILASNTVEVLNYVTPYLTVTPSTVLCPGASCTITLATNPGSIIQWQPPLSGSSLTQIVSSAGTYSCHVTLCGITSDASIVITMANPIAEITPAGPLEICETDSVMLTANAGMAGYQWSVPGSFSPSLFVSQTGTYTLTTTDAFGCTATDNISITVSAPIPPPIASDTTICAGNSVTLQVSSSGNVQWFTSPYGGTPFAIGLSYTTPAITNTTTYYVQNMDSVCPSVRVPVTITVITPPSNMFINYNPPLCIGDTLWLSTDTVPGGIYQWIGPNGFSSALQNPVINNVSINCSGTYSIACIFNGCQGGTSDTTIIIHPNPFLEMGSDTMACMGVPFVIYPGNYTTYLWQDGSTNSTFIADIEGLYVVIVSDVYGCKTNDSVQVNFMDCTEMIIPNVFTPNGDGFNDYFNLYAPGSTNFVCRIYNRWGTLIALVQGDKLSWDGIIQLSGKEASDGVYYYIIGYTDYRGVTKDDHGFFHLIR